MTESLYAYQIKSNGVWTGAVMRYPSAGLTAGWVRASAPPALVGSQVAVFAAGSWVVAEAEPIIATTARQKSSQEIALIDAGALTENYSGLRSINSGGMADKTIVRVLGYAKNGDGGDGKFCLDVSDSSSTDNGGTVLVDASGRRWKRLTDGLVANVCWFGADRTGAVSSAAAVNAAITYLNSLGGSVKLFFPSGKYDLKAGVTQKITKDHFSVAGENALLLCEAGNIFVFDNVVQMRRSAVNGFTFEYTFPTVSTTAVPIICNKVLYLDLENIRVMNAPAVFYLDSCSNVTIEDVVGTTANVGTNALHFNSCAVVSVDDVMLITTAGLQPIDPLAAYSDAPVPGNVFIRITGTINDTYFFKPGVLCNRYHRGFYATCDAGQSLLNIWLESCVFDYSYDKGVFIENLGSSVANIRIMDLYAQAAQGIGVHVKTTGGYTMNVTIARPNICFSGSHGIFIESATGGINNANTIIDDPYIYGGNRLKGGGYDIYCVKSRVVVSGGRVGINSLPYMAIDMQATWGVVLDGCDEYTVKGVESGGSVGGYQFLNNPTTGYRARLVHDNKMALGHSVAKKPDYETSTPVAVVSGDTYTNVSPFKEQVSLFGTSASGAAVVEVNGAQCSSQTEWSGILNPGDTLRVVTAVACTLQRTRLP